MAVVTLDISEFRTLYPQFADSVTYTDAEITAQFDIACTLINNTEQSYIPYMPPRIVMRKRMLYAAVCHLLTLSGQGAEQTGNITSASQGSVSVGFTPVKGNSYPAQWWCQTKCGQLVWMLLTPYRVGGRLYTEYPDYHPYG